ncbi:hypothetical protein GCM10027034_31150 [Ramlibacter solisilvae]
MGAAAFIRHLARNLSCVHLNGRRFQMPVILWLLGVPLVVVVLLMLFNVI